MRQFDELAQTPMDRRLRGGGAALERQLAQWQRRMAKPKLGDLAQVRRQLVDVELLDGLELDMRRPARAGEIRLVCVRLPGCAGLRLGGDGTLGARQMRVARARARGSGGDRGASD